MKIRKLLGGLILSTVLAAGVGLSISSNFDENTISADAASSSWVTGSTVFFDAPDWWTNNKAWSAAYFYNGDGSEGNDTWAAMSRNYFTNTDIFFCPVPAGNWKSVIFVRMADGKTIDDGWNGKYYNQTSDLSFESGKDLFTSEDGSSGSWSVLSSKYTWQVAYGVGSDWATTFTHDLSYKNDGEGAQFYTTNLTLNNTHQLQIKRVSPEGWFGSQYFEDGGAVGNYFTKGSGNNNLVVEVGGTFEFYVKMTNQTVWTQVSSQTEADSYAQTFLSSIKCNSDSTAFAIDVWNKVGSATTSMEYKFEHLTTGAQNVLKGATPSEKGSNVEKCMARYIRILSKYGYGESGPYHDFMGKAPARLGNGAILLNSIVNGSTGTMIAIIAISAVSLAAVGGYFLFRKKKEN